MTSEMFTKFLIKSTFFLLVVKHIISENHPQLVRFRQHQPNQPKLVKNNKNQPKTKTMHNQPKLPKTN